MTTKVIESACVYASFIVSDFNPAVLINQLPAATAGWQPANPGVWRSYWSLYGFLPWLDEVQCDVQCLVENGERVVVQRFAKPGKCRANVVVLHGYMDHVGLYGHLISDLLAQGFQVYSFDLPGHGLSGGEPYAIDTFGHYVDALERVLGQVSPEGACTLIGQSTGGAIILEHQRRHREPARKIDQRILLAPLIRPAGFQSIRLRYQLMHLWLKRVRRFYSENSHDERFLPFVRDQDPLAKHWISVRWIGAMLDWIRELEGETLTLENGCVIQGTGDKTVDWQHNVLRLRTCVPAEAIHLVDGARHHLVNEAPLWRQQVFAHIRARLANMQAEEDTP